MTFALALNAALTATTGNVRAENLAAARDAAELAHNIDRIQAFIDDATTVIDDADVEDEYDVERALNGWEGITYFRATDYNEIVADVGVTAAFNHHTMTFEEAPDTAADLAEVVIADLVCGVRTMILALAEGIEVEEE